MKHGLDLWTTGPLDYFFDSNTINCEGSCGSVVLSNFIPHYSDVGMGPLFCLTSLRGGLGPLFSQTIGIPGFVILLYIHFFFIETLV